MAVARATSIPYFGGSDPALHSAVSAPIQPKSTPATTNGITISVTGFASDDTRTVIGLSIEGHPEFGEGAMPLGQTQLVDEEGRIYREQAGDADQSNPRHVTRYFPALNPASRSLVLEVNGLVFHHRGDPNGTPVSAQWRIQIELANGPQVSAIVQTDASAHPFGKGHVIVDQVRVASTGIVVNAHLEGFSMDEVPELGFNASLREANGKEVPFSGLTAGNGPQRQGIEIRFPVMSGNVELVLHGSVSDPHPLDAALANRLAQSFASSAPATWTLTLP